MYLLSTTKTKRNFFMREEIPRGSNYGLIRSIGVVKHKNRQELLDLMIGGMIKSRSVQFYEIANCIDCTSKTESIERRIQDFFQKTEIDYQNLMLYFLCFIHHERLKLSIDRTEWDFGKTQVNVLCVIVSIGKMGVPLYFEMLDNKSGNSNWEDRIKLFKEIIKVVGIERIELLTMDREFIGHKWLSWLKSKKIDFCVRVPKSHKISLVTGEILKPEAILKEHGNVCLENVVVDGVVVNCSISIDKNGDLLYLIGTFKPAALKAIYKKRWTIEVFFQALKGRGFNLEQSRLRCLKKYRKLFAIASMAYTLCWAAGIEAAKNDPVKPKKHGYPQFSVFRRGLNLFRKYFKYQILHPILKVFDVAFMRFIKFQKILG